MDAALHGLDPVIAWAAHYGSLDRFSGWFLHAFVLLFAIGAAFRNERLRFRSRLQVWTGRVALFAGLYSLLSVPIRTVGLLAATIAELWPALLAAALVLSVVALVLNVTNPLDTPKPGLPQDAEDRPPSAAAGVTHAATGGASDDPAFPKLPAKSKPTRERAAAIEKRLDEEAAREAADKYTRE